jgi:PPM family protein phosphatase
VSIETAIAVKSQSGGGQDRAAVLERPDGLFKYAQPEKICGIARGPDIEQASRELIELVTLPSGELWDDIAIVLCRSRPA